MATTYSIVHSRVPEVEKYTSALKGGYSVMNGFADVAAIDEFFSRTNLVGTEYVALVYENSPINRIPFFNSNSAITTNSAFTFSTPTTTATLNIPGTGQGATGSEIRINSGRSRFISNLLNK